MEIRMTKVTNLYYMHRSPTYPPLFKGHIQTLPMIDKSSVFCAKICREELPGRNNGPFSERNSGPFTDSFSPVSGEHSGNGKKNDSRKKKIYRVETAARLRRVFLPFPESTPETGREIIMMH